MIARLLGCLVVLCMVVGIAGAEDRAAAKKHFERGEKLFALGRFKDALDEYQAAYDAAPIADFLFNMGQCHRNLGDYEAAIFSFRKYLKAMPDADDRAQVEAYIKELEAEQDKRDAARFRLDERPEEPPPVEHGRPVYKKWWFWTAIAAVGAGAGAGVYFGTRTDGPPTTTLGNIVFGK
jgi:tetratricopeptide (TPR) repeat protein